MTEEFRQLKDEIEILIRDDTLWKFSRKDREDKRLAHKVRIPENPINSELVGVIDVIAGVPGNCK